MDDFVIPVLILAASLVVAFFVYRALTSSTSDNTPGTEDSRPLGDTPEAHDEINVHDLPLDNPGRHSAEAMAGDEDATTRGMSEGGGAGGTARFKTEREGAAEVSPEESEEGAKP
jgi:hypothetical protein